MRLLLSGVLGISLSVLATISIVENRGAPKPASVQLYNYGTR